MLCYPDEVTQFSPIFSADFFLFHLDDHFLQRKYSSFFPINAIIFSIERTHQRAAVSSVISTPSFSQAVSLHVVVLCSIRFTFLINPVIPDLTEPASGSDPKL